MDIGTSLSASFPLGEVGMEKDEGGGEKQRDA